VCHRQCKSVPDKKVMVNFLFRTMESAMGYVGDGVHDGEVRTHPRRMFLNGWATLVSGTSSATVQYDCSASLTSNSISIPRKKAGVEIRACVESQPSLT
jgi:hypothetical protein